MNHPGNHGGPYAGDDFGRDGDFVYPSESGQAWQPGWRLGRQADRQDTGRHGAGYGGPDPNGAGYGGPDPNGAGYGRPDPNGAGYNGAYNDNGAGYSGGDYRSGSGSYDGRSYETGSHETGSYDTGSYGTGPYASGEHDAGRHGAAGYDHGQDAYGQPDYRQPDYRQPDYRQPGYGQAAQPGGYDGETSRGYGQNGYSQSARGHDDYREYGGEPTSYGRDLYAQEGHRQGYEPADRPDYRPDTGSFARDDGSWFSRSDTGSFGPPDAGSYGSQDNGSAHAPDTGSFDRHDGYSRPDQQYGGRAGYEQYPPDDSDEAGDWDEEAPGSAPWEDDRDSGLQDGGLQDGGLHDGGLHDGGLHDGGLLSRRFGDGDHDDDRSRRGRRQGRVKRKKRVRGKVAFTGAIVAVALVVAAAGIYGYQRYQTWHTTRYGDYQGAGTGKVDVTVPPGTSLAELGPALMRQGVIEEIRPYDSVAGAAHNADDLQPGVYELRHHMSSALAVSYLLSAAHRIKDQVTIIEGTRASKIAAELSAQTKIPVAQFTQIIEHPPASLGLPSWWPSNMSAEGFLFPDTYTLLPNMTALQVLQAMVREFNEKADSIDLAGAAKMGFTTPYHALVVASMVQAEAGQPSDFGKISRVAWNRIKNGMPLQFDSTIFYALNTYGTAANSQQQKVNSPYNTYAHTGLPPGPISNPGLAALEAAVHPTKGPWLYFIADTRKKPYITHFTASFATFEQWKSEFEG